MAERTDLRKLLILQGPALEDESALGFLREHFEVRIAQELDEALEAMREARFDAVLAATGDFLPLERGIVNQQASLVLDRVGDGVCIVGSGGELVWTNRQMAAFPASQLDALRELCVEAYEQFATTPQEGGGRGKRFSLMPDDGAYFEVICSPICDHQGLLRQVVAVVVNATSQRRQQLKLNAIENAGRELVRLEEGTRGQKDAGQRLRLLEERIIRYSRDVLDYQNFAVLVLDGRTNRLEMLISEGLDGSASDYELFASPEGNGICGYVASTGQSYVCPDVALDPRYLVGMRKARSSLTVPLRLHDKVVGVLNVESARVGAFREEDRQFAEIFGNYVAMTLHLLHLLASERSTAHAQVSSSIHSELSAPLSDIITELTELKDDYIGLDDLRGRLDRIIDHASDLRKTALQLVRAPGSGVLDSAGPRVDVDPFLAGRRVLVVDDESVIRETVGDVLRPHGCVVDLAKDGVEAISLVNQSRYDLVITDIKMPGATGYEVFAAAKKACADTEVILMTAFGYDPNHSIVRANQEGLAAVLFKPFKVRQLLEECRGALLKS
jgi:two-component system, sensor histidine kinase SagS